MTEETNTEVESSATTAESTQEARRRPQRPRRQAVRGRGGYFPRRRRVCAFCIDKTKIIDWKDADLLQRFLTQSGSIQGRRKTGTCARHQRRLAAAIKRARHMALLPYTGHHIRLASK